MSTTTNLDGSDHTQPGGDTGSGSRELHSWAVSPKEAVQIQRRLRPLVRVAGSAAGWVRIAGCDVSVRKDRVRAAIVVWDIVNRKVVETAIHEDQVAFPYVPGLLSFREMPALIPAMQLLGQVPDGLILDAQGIAHPRRMGLATHAGLWFNLPTVGVAKSRLTGTFDPPDMEKGNRSPLMDGEDLIGWVVRTRTNINPVFVSPGHKVDHEAAYDITMRCVDRYKLPEPTRLAHLLSKNGTL